MQKFPYHTYRENVAALIQKSFVPNCEVLYYFPARAVPACDTPDLVILYEARRTQEYILLLSTVCDAPTQSPTGLLSFCRRRCCVRLPSLKLAVCLFLPRCDLCLECVAQILVGHMASSLGRLGTIWCLQKARPPAKIKRIREMLRLHLTYSCYGQQKYKKCNVAESLVFFFGGEEKKVSHEL